jgi:excinuclease ABC subunit A
VPDPSLTIRERAIAAWPPAWHGQNLRDILVTLGYDVDKPWQDLPRKKRDWILFTQDQPTVPVYAGFTPAETRAALRSKMEPSYQGTFIGARKYVLQTFATTQSALMKKRVSRFMVGSLCPSCHGKRLNPQALSVKFAGRDIAEVSDMPLTELARLLEPVARGRFDHGPSGAARSRASTRRDRDRRVAAGGSAHAAAPDIRRTPNLSEEKQVAAQRIAGNMLDRVRTLNELGLGYLSLSRATPTLSPGELQRVRLATQIRSNLFGVIYVLDEPSAGLHPSDAKALLTAFDQLKTAGNTLFVVEHDLDVMRHADWLVDVGPEAGELGGEVLHSGPPAALRGHSASHTARYLFPTGGPHTRRTRVATEWLTLRHVSRNNLHRLDAAFPIACMSAVTGISGSGKSSLVSQALLDLVCGQLGSGSVPDDPHQDEPDLSPAGRTTGEIVGGLKSIRRLVSVDQKPIGRTPRSNLATYTGLFDHVRRLFAATRDARTKRYGIGRFSFNVAGGRCETCEGEGFVSVELLFMPSIYAPCPTCHGARYNDATLKIELRGKNIAQVLGLTVSDALIFFDDDPAIARPLQLLQGIGLGYLRLGQPATELSGGEAQRIKLATGLHPADVDKLMAQLQGLVDGGNTVVLVEHEMRVVAQADWVIDMGPDAGAQGGRVVVAGVPSDICASLESRTAPFLRALVTG